MKGVAERRSLRRGLCAVAVCLAALQGCGGEPKEAEKASKREKKSLRKVEEIPSIAGLSDVEAFQVIAAAAESGKQERFVELMEQLFEDMSQLNRSGEIFGKRDERQGNTLLHYAAACHSVQPFERIASLYAFPDLFSHECPCAEDVQNKATADEIGKAWRAKNKRGQTPIMIAELNGANFRVRDFIRRFAAEMECTRPKCAAKEDLLNDAQRKRRNQCIRCKEQCRCAAEKGRSGDRADAGAQVQDMKEQGLDLRDMELHVRM